MKVAPVEPMSSDFTSTTEFQQAVHSVNMSTVSLLNIL